MIQNREQLIQAATEWTNMAKQDLTNKLVEFTEATGASKGELSEVLAIPVSEIEAIFNGRGNISLSTFAKLIIATDNVLEIKPLAESPFANYGEMPNPSRMRMPFPTPNGGVRRIPNDPIPPHMGGMPRIPRQGIRRTQEPGEMMGMDEGTRNPFERTRRSTRPSEAPTPQRPIPAPFGNNPQAKMVEVDLDELGKRELMEIISQNGWAREIDFNTTSRSGLIDFIKYKDSMSNNETNEVSDSEVDRITEMLKAEVKRNPKLRSVVEKYLK